MRDFEYLPTKTIKEACSLISQYKEEGKILAGGQSLITLLRQKLISPSYLIDIKGISELNYITFDEKNGLRMGALTTHRAIEKSPIIQKKYNVLSEMEKSVASVQTRNWGTIGGNLCSADPIGDPAPSLIALSAKIKIVSSRGGKTIPLDEFFTDYFTTLLEPDEILTEIQLPSPVAHTGVVYMKFSTIEAGIKIVSTSISITLESDRRTCKDAKIVMSAVAPVPFNAKKAGNLMAGKKINDDLIAEAAQLASEETNPTPDVHASAEFRREIANVLVKRAIKQAFEKAKIA
ncbi:MAG: xanthine dehydrogenase family protein subunit M [Deltaproteobacteria bacterium CG_4_8_14_3_um_filter_45_9]|nr:MAG: xanthine dehydrogenase family protein subunit M [Deltaproteobacteria bacterium CG03_land_8_20_14_0_80_45_14]PIX23562.1 MAG: xanthine dehydrogenase family protein subunit M [Deltaproteobacteria bacterium CG_4_8_14_3_um_filter_45_9]